PRRPWEISMRYRGASLPACGLWPLRFGPARGGGIVMLARFDPACAFAAFLALPERRIRLEVVHQEFRCFEGCLAVRRSGHDQHDVLARRDAAEAMNDGEALQRP